MHSGARAIRDETVRMVVERIDAPVSPRLIAVNTTIDRDVARGALDRMAADGVVAEVEEGIYAPASG